jgi:hypothetical protein
MTDPRDRLLAPCLVGWPDDIDSLAIDLGAIVTRLLLFERYVIDSVRLKEIAPLVNTVGIKAVEALLEAGCVEINCDARTVGQTGQLAVLEERQQRGVLPPRCYSFSLLSVSDREEYLHSCLQEMQPHLDLPLKKVIELKRKLLDRITVVPDALGSATMTQLGQDLANNRDVCRVSLLHHLRQEEHRDLTLADIECSLDEIAEGDFRARTNLETLGYADEQSEHRIVERALLAVGGLNLRLERMEALAVVSGFRQEELPIFDSKLDYLARQLDPDVQVERFHRIVELAGLPDPGTVVDAGDVIDVDKLLKVRELDECREFRAWLRGIDSDTDKELQQRVDGLRARVSEAIRSPAGRVLRFSIAAGAGFIPGAGIVAGPALGAIDAFVVDRLLSAPGPAAFLSHEYMSLFDGA